MTPNEQQQRHLAYIAKHTVRYEWVNLAFPNAHNVDWRDHLAMIDAGWIRIRTPPGCSQQQIRLTRSGRTLATCKASRETRREACLSPRTEDTIPIDSIGASDTKETR